MRHGVVKEVGNWEIFQSCDDLVRISHSLKHFEKIIHFISVMRIQRVQLKLKVKKDVTSFKGSIGCGYSRIHAHITLVKSALFSAG